MSQLFVNNEKQRERAVAEINKLDVKENVWIVSIVPRRPTRSLEQNALYWAMLSEIADHTGHDVDELHEYFKRKFLGMEPVEINGEVIDVPRSTRRLNKADFSEYLERVRAFAFTLDIVV